MKEPIITTDLPTTHDNKGCVITVGTKVRSFDFPEASREPSGKDACFVEGVVLGVERQTFDCPRYAIRPTRCVFGGNEAEVPESLIFPPLNGTSKWLGGVCDGVEVIP